MTPRKLSLVKFKDPHESFNGDKGPYIYLGEIPNMIRHCIVLSSKTNNIHSGYHIDNFIELDDEEI